MQGDLEVRIRNFNANDTQFIGLIKSEYKILNKYYKLAAKHNCYKAQALHQYRIHPRNYEQNQKYLHLIQIFDVQSYQGKNFFMEIVDQVLR